MKTPPDATTPITLPFVASCKLGWRLFALVMSPLTLWLLLGAKGADGVPAVIEVWEQGGVLMKLGVIFMILGVPAFPIDVFRARTIFTEDEIRHLPSFGRWRTYRYQDIVDLEVFPNEFSRLEFRDGRLLKIWAMRADPHVVEAIIRQKWKPPRESVRSDARELGKH